MERTGNRRSPSLPRTPAAGGHSVLRTAGRLGPADTPANPTRKRAGNPLQGTPSAYASTHSTKQISPWLGMKEKGLHARSRSRGTGRAGRTDEPPAPRRCSARSPKSDRQPKAKPVADAGPQLRKRHRQRAGRDARRPPDRSARKRTAGPTKQDGKRQQPLAVLTAEKSGGLREKKVTPTPATGPISADKRLF